MPGKNYIKVKSGRLDAKVVISEKDPAHPGGEAFVAASEGVDGIGLVNEPVEVGRTALVDQKIHEGELVVVDGGGARAERRLDVSDEARAQQKANADQAAELERQAEEARKDAEARAEQAKAQQKAGQ